MEKELFKYADPDGERLTVKEYPSARGKVYVFIEGRYVRLNQSAQIGLRDALNVSLGVSDVMPPCSCADSGRLGIVHRDNGKPCFVYNIPGAVPDETPDPDKPGTTPGLLYLHTDGETVTQIDRETVYDPYNENDDSDARHREQLVCKALIEHATALMDGDSVA